MAGAKGEMKGASGGTRTLDPSLTKRLLCRLSYAGLVSLFWISKSGGIIPAAGGPWQETPAEG